MCRETLNPSSDGRFQNSIHRRAGAGGAGTQRQGAGRGGRCRNARPLRRILDLRTKDGIAGVQVLFDLSVFHSKMAAAETLKRRTIAALDGTTLAGKRCIYKSSEYGFYADFNIHGYTITFKIV